MKTILLAFGAMVLSACAPIQTELRSIIPVGPTGAPKYTEGPKLYV